MTNKPRIDMRPVLWALFLGIILVSVIGVVLHSLGGLS